MQFQQDQVDLFCQHHTHPPSTLPLEDIELDSLFKHLLYDDSRKMVFCYVPKNGCSNMKRMMLVLNGILPPKASKEKRPPESLLKEVSIWIVTVKILLHVWASSVIIIIFL